MGYPFRLRVHKASHCVKVNGRQGSRRWLRTAPNVFDWWTRGLDLTPYLQSRPGKILTALAGVAYADNRQDSRSPDVPKLYRVGRVWNQERRVPRKEPNSIKMGPGSIRARAKHQRSCTREIQLPKANFTFESLRYPLHCQFLALFRAVEKIKVN
jgi:hypothetical protein